MTSYYVQLGPFGHVGRLEGRDTTAVDRGAQVVCRTPRGLEIGQVLGIGPPTDSAGDGRVLRPMTDVDRLLEARIRKNRDRAFDACVRMLRDRGIEATLMDVELLFDGATLFFYFLGPVDPSVEALTAELAEAYDAKVKLRDFSRRLAEGCGPGCGTDSAEAGCGSSGGCQGCALSGGCATRG